MCQRGKTLSIPTYFMQHTQICSIVVLSPWMRNGGQLQIDTPSIVSSENREFSKSRLYEYSLRRELGVFGVSVKESEELANTALWERFGIGTIGIMVL